MGQYSTDKTGGHIGLSSERGSLSVTLEEFQGCDSSLLVILAGGQYIWQNELQTEDAFD